MLLGVFDWYHASIEGQKTCGDYLSTADDGSDDSVDFLSGTDESNLRLWLLWGCSGID